MVISIVIPTLYPKFNLTRLLQSIAESEFDHKRIDIILVGNQRSSSRYLLELSKKWRDFFYDVRSLCTGVRSANIARNSGIRMARGELIFFIDDDCLVADKSYFKKMTSFMQENPHVSGLGGCYGLDESYSKRTLDKSYAMLAKHWLDQAVFSDTGETQYLIGGNCCYRASVFSEGFSFDPTMSFGGTETSLNSQLMAAGKTLIYRPEFQLKHRFKISLYSFIKKAYGQGRGKAHNLAHNQLKIREVNKNKSALPFSNFYTSCYDYFFQLGVNSKAKKSRFDWKSWGQYLELLFFPPRVQNRVKHYFSIMRHRLVMAGIFFYYRVIHKIFCKIYYMSEYHWRVYIRPIGSWINRCLRGRND